MQAIRATKKALSERERLQEAAEDGVNKLRAELTKGMSLSALACIA